MKGKIVAEWVRKIVVEVFDLREEKPKAEDSLLGGGRFDADDFDRFTLGSEIEDRFNLQDLRIPFGEENVHDVASLTAYIQRCVPETDGERISCMITEQQPA